MQSVRTNDGSKTKTKGATWVETTLGILYVVEGNVQFADDWDHWKNGFRRLLEIDDQKARALIEACVEIAQAQHKKLLHELSDTERVACLKEATTQVLYGGKREQGQFDPAKCGKDQQGAPPNHVYAWSISGDRARMVVGNTEHEYAWLLNSKTSQTIYEKDVVYDTAYYSSGGNAHYGPKHYLNMEEWRLEKCRRLAKLVTNKSGERGQGWLTDPENTRVLDVGSGLGYNRKAFEEMSMQHFGVELSTDIIAKSKEAFGFETWHGTAFDLSKLTGGQKFDIITMWDVIEHIEDPVAAIKELRTHLTDSGVLVLRTPNLVAFEVDILGDFYYSFKFDHLRYFSPKSLAWAAKQAGLDELYVETASHLFKGLLSTNFIYHEGLNLRGADIIGIYGADLQLFPHTD